MSHRKTLTQLGWFKVAFFAPLAVGAIVAGFISWHDFFSIESMNACGTSDCINDALGRLKLPIAIMALIFPAVALVASHHRSAQTVAQIERTDQQIQIAQEEKRQKEIDSALVAFLYFRRISRIATLLASNNNIEFKRGNGRAKYKIDEIYDGWKRANNSDDCVRCIIFADNWAIGIDLIDTFEQALDIVRSLIHQHEDNYIEKVESPLLKMLSHCLYIFSMLSHLQAREKSGLKGDDVWIETEKNAQDSLERLKLLYTNVKDISARG